MHCHYRRLLLEKKLSDTFNMDFIKNLTAKDCVYLVAKAWDKVLESTLFKTWNKVFITRESAEDGDLERLKLVILLCHKN